MPRLPNPGADSDAWGDLLNQFLQVAHRQDGSLKSTSQVINVKDYGATGDGVTDDTISVQNAIAAIRTAVATLYFPSGNYLITGTLSFNQQMDMEVRGNGWSSNIVWGFDGNLFQWPLGVICQEVTVSDLKITSDLVAKSADSAAISCQGGVARSLFDHLLLFFNGAFYPGTGIDFVGICDSTTIRDCQFWQITGVGVSIGNGSEIRIEGGRIIGTNSVLNGSIGVHLTGNNGGVHIVETDVIGLQYGVLIDNSSGAGSNREIFITHATLDSCWRGLELLDDSYVCMVGCWAASCYQDNIHVQPGLANPILSISGGTIFNAGVAGGDAVAGRNGITINSGTFILSGVHVRNNLGVGIWVPNSSVSQYSITGCRITNNGQGANLMGSCYQIGHCIFASNSLANQFVGTNFQTTDNVSC